MGATVGEFGGYGIVNGLGIRGDARDKERLLRNVSRAVNRGDWDWVLTVAAAYSLGAIVGSETRKALSRWSSAPVVRSDW
jgi:hypothetical protein